VADVPARLTAALADRYRIERELGAGGMATVYLAHDLKHDRKVALKVLRPELSAVIGGERFLAEIKTTANLQHPHILALFDSGEVDGTVFYVMPYVEGESLRDRLNREKQLPVDDALRIASEVADALEYAHGHGVIHRDIKPENVLLHGGHALVADFGIALAVSRSDGGTRMTETGMSLGTPHYMSPEQAMGEREITPAADVYALGAMLYEMLVGDPPFTGSTAQAIVAKVLTAAPASVTQQRHTVPPHVEAAVLKALEKLPADRFASAAQFAAALGDTTAVSNRPAPRDGSMDAARTAGASGRAAVVGAVAVAAALALGWLLRGWVQRPAEPAPVRFTFDIGHPGLETPMLAISADGRRIAMQVEDSAGADHLVERDLATTALRTIPGTDGGDYPQYSPDGRWLAYATTASVRRIPVGGGTSTAVTDSGSNNAAAWLADGSLIVAGERGLIEFPAARGHPLPLTHLDTARHEFRHWNPLALPGGRAVVFTAYATPVTRSRIEAVDLQSHEITPLVDDAMFAQYATPGYLLFMRDQTIFAVRFDPASLKISGTPTPVQGDVYQQVDDGLGSFAVSPNGTLVYVSAQAWNVPREVVWVDRDGHATRALPDTGSWAEPRLSPDGRWIAVTQVAPKKTVLLYDVTRKLLTGLTHAPGVAFNAVWMPDSRHLIYDFETPQFDLHEIAADGTSDTAVVSTPLDKYATSISSDGRLVAYTEETSTGSRITIAQTDGRGAPRALDPKSRSDEREPAFSPDGRWIAYASNPNGRYDVLLRAADGSGGRHQISVDGGTEPRWTRGGRELVYRRGTAMMAVPINPATGDAGTPVMLFNEPVVGSAGNERDVTYDVTPDGNRFLMVRPVQRAGMPTAVVVLNWFTELREKMKQ